MNIYLYIGCHCCYPIHEWQRVRNSLPSCIHEVTDLKADAERIDVIVCYFCAMTSTEINGVSHYLEPVKQFKATHPRVRVIIGGCISQVIDNLEQRYPFVDGTFDKDTAAQDILNFLQLPLNTSAPAPISRVPGIYHVVIAYGCDRHCSFCEVHYMNNPFRSVPIETIYQDIDYALEQGAYGISLVAANASCWGIDLYGESKFEWLVQNILRKYPTIKVINALGITIDEASDQLIEFLANHPKILHIQAEVQSFIPAVRERMGLTKSADDIKEIIATLYRKKPFTSHLIVGHPGETDADFEAQLRYIADHDYYMFDAIPIISTPGTPTSRMAQIPDTVIKKRLEQAKQQIYQLRLKRSYEILGLDSPHSVLELNEPRTEPAIVEHSKGDVAYLQFLHEPINGIAIGSYFTPGDNVTFFPIKIAKISMRKHDMIILQGCATPAI